MPPLLNNCPSILGALRLCPRWSCSRLLRQLRMYLRTLTPHLRRELAVPPRGIHAGGDDVSQGLHMLGWLIGDGG